MPETAEKTSSDELLSAALGSLEIEDFEEVDGAGRVVRKGRRGPNAGTAQVLALVAIARELQAIRDAVAA